MCFNSETLQWPQWGHGKFLGIMRVTFQDKKPTPHKKLERPTIVSHSDGQIITF